ncbi:hypothetical protein TNCV_2681851 [Trichonephila clavipes]|nr:hypothetical protein TNCV_2681851 [Trichonephila clavipes]
MFNKCKLTVYKKRKGHLRSRLDEVETDQATEEPDELMDFSPDSENKFEKSDEHETFELFPNSHRATSQSCDGKKSNGIYGNSGDPLGHNLNTKINLRQRNTMSHLE